MNCSEKLQRNTHGILIIKTEDEEQFRKKFKEVNLERRCTVCNATTRNSFHPHPALRVIVCENCLVSYENTVFLSHKDGTDQNCRWCAKLAERYCCSKCTAVFCEVCLSRNFGNDFINTKITNSEGWNCLFCEPKQIWSLRAAYAHAIDTVDTENVDPDVWREKTLSSEVRKLAQQFLIITKNDFQSFADKIQTEIKNFSYIVDETRLGSYVDVERQVCRIAAFCGLIVKFITQLNQDQAKHFYCWSENNFNYVPKIDLGISPAKVLPSLSKNSQTQENLINTVVKIEQNEDDNVSTSTVRVTDDFQYMNPQNSPVPCTSAQSEAVDTSEINKELKHSPKTKFKLSLNKPPVANILLSSISSQESFERFLDKIHKPSSITDNCSENTSNTPQFKELRVCLVDFRKHHQPSLLIHTIKHEVADNVSIFSKATDVLDDLSDAATEPFCEEDLLPDVRLTKTLCDKTGDFFDAYIEENKSSDCPTEQPFTEATSSQEEPENQHLGSRDWEAISLSENDLFTEEHTKLDIKHENAIIEQEVDSQTTDQNKDDIVNEDESSVGTENTSPSFLARTCAMEALLDSDDLTKISSNTSTSSSSAPSSKRKNKKLKKIKHSKSNGYIKTLDLAKELEKLQKNETVITSTTPSPKNSKHDLFSNSSSSSESEEDLLATKSWKKPTRIYSSSEEDNVDTRTSTPTIDDQKLKQICEVRVAKINFDHCYGLKRLGNSDVFKILVKSPNKNDKDELKELTSLKPLKNTSNSSESSDDDMPRVRKKKRRKFKSRALLLSDSETNNTVSSSSDTNISEADLTDYTTKHDDDVIDILMSTDDSNIEYCTLSSDSEAGKTKNKDKPVEDKPQNVPANKSAKEVPQWRRDKLLVSSFNLPNSGASTSNYLAEEMMEKEEEIYLQRNRDKVALKRKKPVEDNTISLSDESSDEDSSLLSKKRKLSSADDELELTQTKIGRKNIREVLDDSQLQENTQKADKEEEKRKERISSRHKLMETLLSQSQPSEEIKEEMGLVLDIDNETKKMLVEIPHILTKRLKKHQTEGIKFMWDICCESVKEMQNSNGAGCILAHCMGLGKTLQVILLTHAILTNPSINMKHVVVVCPLSTVFNWKIEFEDGLKDAEKKINIFDIRPSNQKNFNHKVYEVRAWWSSGGVLIISYETFTILVQQEKYGKMPNKYFLEVKNALINPGPDVIICDEGHILKNGSTLKFKALSKIKTLRRIILTGTPLQNNLKEYYHMVNFVKPHLLGTLKEFANRFMNPIQNGQYQDSSVLDIQLMKKRSHILHKKLETTVHRYGVSELKKYLPLKHDYVLYVQLTELQINLYEKYLELLRNSIRSKMLFNNYHDLQNIWTHPALLHLKFEKKKTAPPPPTYDEDFVDVLDPDNIKNAAGFDDNWFRELMPNDLIDLKYSNKMVILFSIIQECIEFDDKLLVFSSCMSELDLIEGFLSAYNFKGNAWVKGQDFFRLDGTIHIDQRTTYCQSFNDPNNKRVRLFLVSHKVGGLGLNLIAANRVVLMDVSWNPSYDIQSVFRIYRFGQKKECYIYRLVSVGTMEEIVYTRSVTKLATSCRVVDEQQIQRHFKEDDKHKLYILTKDFPEPPPPKLPSDRLIAKLWEHHRNILYKFCDHQSLLENQTEEELNAEEMKVAWEEFRKEEEDFRTMSNMDTVNKAGPIPIQPRISDTVMPSTSSYIDPSFGYIPTTTSINPISRVNPPYFSNLKVLSDIIQRYKSISPKNSNISNAQPVQNDSTHRFKKPMSQTIPNQRQVPNDIGDNSTVHNNNITRALQSQLPSVATQPVQNNIAENPVHTASNYNYTLPAQSTPTYSTPPQVGRGNFNSTPIPSTAPQSRDNFNNPHTASIQQSTIVPRPPSLHDASSYSPQIRENINPQTTPIQQPTTAPRSALRNQRPSANQPSRVRYHHAPIFYPPPPAHYQPPPSHYRPPPPRYQSAPPSYQPHPTNYELITNKPALSNPTSTNQIQRTSFPMKVLPTPLNFQTPTQPVKMLSNNNNPQINTSFLNSNNYPPSISSNTQPAQFQNNTVLPPYGYTLPSPQNPMRTSGSNSNNPAMNPLRPTPPALVRDQLQETPGNSLTGELVFTNASGGAMTVDTTDQQIIQLE